MKNNKSLFFYFLIFLCFSNNKIFAQSSVFGFNKYVNGKGDSLNYRLLSPDYDTVRRFPLLIFLHGSGERGNDNEAQLKWGIKNFTDEKTMLMYPAIILAPQCPLKMSWSNFSENRNSRDLKLLPAPSKPMELLIGLINQLKKQMPVDSNRIYITGLSMGGYGTYDAIERFPDLFAAAVPVCGAGDTSKAASIAHIPIWIYHGALDAAVNPLYSLDMLEALTKAGSHPGFTQYPSVGHFSWLGAYSDPQMIEWLFRQHK